MLAPSAAAAMSRAARNGHALRQERCADGVAAAGLNVWDHLCERKPKGAPVERCEFYNTCPYVAQFQPAKGVRVFAHDTLAMPAKHTQLGPPDLCWWSTRVFTASCCDRHRFRLERLTASRPRPKGNAFARIKADAVLSDLDALAQKTMRALVAGQHPRDAGVTVAGCMFAEGRDGDGGPREHLARHVWSTQKAVVATLKRSLALRLRRFWLILAGEIEHDTPLQRIRLERDVPAADGELHDMVRLDWRAELKIAEVPTLLIDADLDPLIARVFWPHIEVQTITARRNAEVIQVHDTPCSRRRLLGYASADESEQKRSGNRLADVQALIDVEARNGPVLCVTYKPAAEKLKAPPGSAIAHFGAIRGLEASRATRRSSLPAVSSPGCHRRGSGARAVRRHRRGL